jgi:hypothetical protein
MRRLVIILLTLITAGIHIYFYTLGNGLLFTMFLLNAVGYLGLLGLLYLPLKLPASLHKWVRPVFIGYTILTIALYFIMNAKSGTWSLPLGPVTKVAEAILAWQLWVEGKKQI